MLSIITPSVRKKGLSIIKNSLQKQGFRDYEWLIGSKFNPEIPEARWVVDDFGGGYWSLNRIYNKMIRESRGELIISLQDWIYLPPDALEKMWISYQNTKGIISGVGNQYERMGKYRPEICIWQDPRKHVSENSFYEINPEDNEWNFCAVPRQALVDIGGFDNGLDQLGFGMDGYQVNERMDALGWKFYIDQTCESFTIRHNRDAHGGDDNWNNNNNLNNGQYNKRKKELIEKGEWPILHNNLTIIK